MKPRASVSLLGVLIGVLSVAMAGDPALAQAQVSLGAQAAAQGTSLGDLLADPGQWATTMFNAALVGLGQKTTSDVVGFMGWLLGNGNLSSARTLRPRTDRARAARRRAATSWSKK